MALVKCNECGKSISNKAPSCPHCGYVNLFCEECGESLAEDKICKNCGYDNNKKEEVLVYRCDNCNSVLEYGTNKCPNCSANLSWPNMPENDINVQKYIDDQSYNGLSIAGFVCSFFPILCILSIVFCSIGLKSNKKGKGLATAGLVISIFWALILWVAILGEIE